MSSKKQRIDHILKEWPFDPFAVNVRLIEDNSRMILQMRVDMGILQLEADGRPDGIKPHGAKTYYEFLKRKAKQNKEKFQLDEDHCVEIDREFVQFYHRRVCWLQLKQFDRAVRDADHTLGLMDFCKEFSADEEWTISHEQYRPFVLYHRTQAAALSVLNDDDSTDAAELAIEEVNSGLERMQELFIEYDAEEQFEEDELVRPLLARLTLVDRALEDPVLLPIGEDPLLDLGERGAGVDRGIRRLASGGSHASRILSALAIFAQGRQTIGCIRASTRNPNRSRIGRLSGPASTSAWR